MNKITWKDEYSVGTEDLDSQHKDVMKLINRLIDYTSSSMPSEKFADILHDVHKHYIEHLEYEVQLLKKLHYPAFEEHNDLHEKYHETIALLTFDASEYDDLIPQKLLDFLNHLWTEHLLVEDMKYKEFIQSNPHS
jgi:hemerythrin